MAHRFSHILITVVLCTLLAACSSGPEVPEICTVGKTIAPKKATSRPYQIKGIWYYPQPHFEYAETGIASYYGGGDVFHGRPTATGERFDMNDVSAAHKTLPLPCVAIVTNLENGREIQVKVNDRGPFIEGRIIDVSRRTAQLLGFENKGIVKVHVRTLVPESLALHGIDPRTAMTVQSAPVPSSVPEVAPSIPVSVSYARLPDSLFEEMEEQKPAATKKKKDAKPRGIFINAGEHEVGPFESMLAANQELDQLLNAGHAMSRIVIHR